MTRTRKQHFLITLLALALLLTPLFPALAAKTPNAPASVSVQALGNKQVYIEFETQPGADYYRIIATPNSGKAEVFTGTSGSAWEISQSLTLGDSRPYAFTVEFSSDNQTWSAPTSGGRVDPGVPGIAVNLTGGYSALNFTNISSQDKTMPTYVFYGGTLEFDVALKDGMFSSPFEIKLPDGSKATITRTGNHYKITGIKEDITLLVSGVLLQAKEYYSTPQNATYSGSGSLAFVATGSYASFLQVSVANMALTKTQYSLKATDAGIEVTFPERYLKALDPGTYTVRFVFLDGFAESKLTIGSPSSSGNATTTSKCTVYATASSKGKKLGSFAKSTAIQFKSFTPTATYALVTFGTGEGYINANYINVTLPTALTGKLSSRTYLSTQRSSSSKYRLVRLDSGSALKLLAREGSYWKVEHEGKAAYVSAKYVKLG